MEAMIKVADADNDGLISLVLCLYQYSYLDTHSLQPDFVKLMIRIQEVKKQMNDDILADLADLSDQLEAKVSPKDRC